jgi:hypothetical protein
MEDMMSERDGHRLRSALETYGADMARWPDASAAARARRAALADPAFRAAWDEARALDGEIDAHRRALDSEIAAAGTLERVRTGALARLARRSSAVRWRQVAAAMLAAALIGGVAGEMLLKPVETADAADLVLLDPLAPGPNGGV